MPMPEPLSLALRRAAERRYDGIIPLEVQAAIAAQDQAERDAAALAGRSEAECRRFRAAREFAAAKLCFRPLCRQTRTRVLRRPWPAWFAVRDRARAEAESHVEAWRSLRHREARARAA